MHTDTGTRIPDIPGTLTRFITNQPGLEQAHEQASPVLGSKVPPNPSQPRPSLNLALPQTYTLGKPIRQGGGGSRRGVSGESCEGPAAQVGQSAPWVGPVDMPREMS